jgi:hypothetical protein
MILAKAKVISDSGQIVGFARAKGVAHQVLPTPSGHDR